MIKKLNILGINGSASQNSSNLAILKAIGKLGGIEINLTIIENLRHLPHFQIELTSDNTPPSITKFRKQLENADGIIISTPEYVFSIPSGLKNALEWCVSTTILSDKSVGLITASANGKMGHEELKLIMKTVQTYFTDTTTLLIPGVKGKVNEMGEIINDKTQVELLDFTKSFIEATKKHIGFVSY